MSLQEFRVEFLDEIRADATIIGTDAGDEFIRKSLETLQELGELQDPIQYYFGKTFGGNRTMQIDGYSFDEAEKSLGLIISDFEDTYSPEDINRGQIEDVLSKRLRNFLELACNSKLENYCDDSDDVIKLARLIRNRMNDPLEGILKIKFYIITNKKLSDKVKKLKQTEFENKPVEINIWHIERFYEIANSYNNEPITIDLINDFNSRGIPCIKGAIGENLGYQAYIAILPGKLLADIYIEHGSRVLEGNIRAFLGATGSKSVNSGIKKTIVTEPSKFFTYNNGIAATASQIELNDSYGELRITKIEDMQIINGGQTTASLAAAVLKKDNLLLNGIYVPMKITVIEDREIVDDDGIKFYDQMVQNISRFANSQNKVTAADFFSNSPFHIIMERLSKKHYAPPVNGNLNPTGWYYERSRKKYEQEQIKMTKAEKERFSLKYPKKQIITKDKLAKYLYCIECKPYIVARGSNWTMKDFGNSINLAYQKNKDIFNEYYYKKCVAAGIIFNTIDSVVLNAPWYQKGGYKLNIVPYTISKIVSSLPKGYSIDWQKIWQKQSLSPAFMREIEIVTKITNDFVINSHGVIVTEYCKKEETWTNYRDKTDYLPLDDFLKELVNTEEVIEQTSAAKKEQKQLNTISVEIEVYKLGANYWQQLLDEGKKNNVLGFKDVSLLKVAADMEKTGMPPSPSQANAIMIIRDKLDGQGIFVK